MARFINGGSLRRRKELAVLISLLFIVFLLKIRPRRFIIKKAVVALLNVLKSPLLKWVFRDSVGICCVIALPLSVSKIANVSTTYDGKQLGYIFILLFPLSCKHII